VCKTCTQCREAVSTYTGDLKMLKFLRRMFCRHTHGKLVTIEFDGVAVYECVACGKFVRKSL